MRRTQPAPAHDERFELRAPASEVDRWKRAASREQIALSAWLRRVAREASARAPSVELLNELQEMVVRDRAQFPDASRTLHLTHADELALMTAKERHVGTVLASRLLTDGARGAFPRLFGLTVRWGAAARQIGPTE